MKLKYLLEEDHRSRANIIYFSQLSWFLSIPLGIHLSLWSFVRNPSYINRLFINFSYLMSSENVYWVWQAITMFSKDEWKMLVSVSPWSHSAILPFIISSSRMSPFFPTFSSFLLSRTFSNSVSRHVPTSDSTWLHSCEMSPLVLAHIRILRACRWRCIMYHRFCNPSSKHRKEKLFLDTR